MSFKKIWKIQTCLTVRYESNLFDLKLEDGASVYGIWSGTMEEDDEPVDDML